MPIDYTQANRTSKDLRDIIIVTATSGEPLNDKDGQTKLLAMSLVYLADKISEATSDIGPSIDNGVTKLSGEVADVSQAMRDGNTEAGNIAVAIKNHATILDNLDGTLRLAVRAFGN